MTTLRTFLSQRETEIKSQIKALRAELSEVQTAKSALENGVVQNIKEADPQSNGQQTIKEMVIEVLKEAPEGLEANDIIDRINLFYGKKIQRTSLSPQLTRLKRDEKIQLNENLWKLWCAENKSPQDEPEGLL